MMPLGNFVHHLAPLFLGGIAKAYVIRYLVV